MTKQTTIVTLFEVKGKPDQYISEAGQPISPPSGWSFLPAGDAALTRRVTKDADYWKVCYKKGRRVYTKGIWAQTSTIEQAKQYVKAMREDDGYQKKLESSRASRARAEDRYVVEFTQAIVAHLNFHPSYAELAIRMSKLISEHATPVGSGTVARTKMIPIEQRAAKAVTAWMRHQTTEYDNMQIKRVKGARREVRSTLAKSSNSLLQNYRDGIAPSTDCPLWSAVYSNETQE